MPTEEKTVIQLDEHWRIESDARSWNLLYNKQGGMNPLTNRPVESRDAHYCASLRHALEKYLEESMSGAQDIQGVIDRIEQAEKNVNAALDKLYKKMKEG